MIYNIKYVQESMVNDQKLKGAEKHTSELVHMDMVWDQKTIIQDQRFGAKSRWKQWKG